MSLCVEVQSSRFARIINHFRTPNLWSGSAITTSKLGGLNCLKTNYNCMRSQLTGSLLLPCVYNRSLSIAEASAKAWLQSLLLSIIETPNRSVPMNCVDFVFLCWEGLLTGIISEFRNTKKYNCTTKLTCWLKTKSMYQEKSRWLTHASVRACFDITICPWALTLWC
jgi:hypothetical protein